RRLGCAGKAAVPVLHGCEVRQREDHVGWHQPGRLYRHRERQPGLHPWVPQSGELGQVQHQLPGARVRRPGRLQQHRARVLDQGQCASGQELPAVSPHRLDRVARAGSVLVPLGRERVVPPSAERHGGVQSRHTGVNALGPERTSLRFGRQPVRDYGLFGPGPGGLEPQPSRSERRRPSSARHRLSQLSPASHVHGGPSSGVLRSSQPMKRSFVKASIRAAGFFTLLLVPLQGCTNLDESPRSGIVPSNFFKSEAEVLASLAGTYAQLRSTLDDYYNVSEISTDEMVVPTRGQDWYDGGTWLDLHFQTWTGTSAATGAFMNGAWNALFGGVARANVLLDALQTTAVPNQAQIEGEARVLRAFYYYLL